MYKRPQTTFPPNPYFFLYFVKVQIQAQEPIKCHNLFHEIGVPAGKTVFETRRKMCVNVSNEMN